MTDEEFEVHWKPLRDEWHLNRGGVLAEWPQHIKDHLYMLPIECVDMMSRGEPGRSGWSPDVVRAAASYVIEYYLLKGE